MKIKAKVSIQTKERMYAPGEVLTISSDEGYKLINNGHAVLATDSPDPEPESEAKSEPEGKPDTKSAKK
jgi:hypothetical protein